MQRILFVVALILGVMITYVDSRPTWDDAGVTAGALLLLSGVFGFLGPNRPWLWALALGLWIPLLGFVNTHNYASVLALIVCFAGAYGGMAIRTWLSPVRN
jgi:hypothetical protein